MSREIEAYMRLCRDFRWEIPEYFNIGVAVCDRHARGDRRLAMIHLNESGEVSRYTFDDFKDLTNRFANVLLNDGIGRGDRVAVFLPQSPETAVAHVAAFKAGCISLPLFTLFGEEALEYRLRDSGAKAIVTDTAGAEKVEALKSRLPDLRQIYVVGTDRVSSNNTSFKASLDAASSSFTPVETRASDPAIIIYTSGTTGNPKGTLHAHHVLIGHIPGIDLIYDGFPRPGDIFWTPADWAWIAGLFDALLMSWYHGVPVLAKRLPKFEPEVAANLMAKFGIRNVFMPPTALRMLRQSGASTTGISLRTMFTGGEALGSDLLDWVYENFRVPLHEGYGQTECNIVLGSNARLFPTRPGSMGKRIPGHEVCIIDSSGRELPRGETGIIGIRRPNPVMLLEYWNNPTATKAKFSGEFLNTGDLGRQDDDGYFWYVSRSDDVITSGGYRIGPSEIEDCLVKHPAVALAAVVGVPDPIRTESIKAWLVLRPGITGSPELVRGIQDFVRTKLAGHEYPRQIAFTDTLPMTATGKIKRGELRARG